MLDDPSEIWCFASPECFLKPNFLRSQNDLELASVGEYPNIPDFLLASGLWSPTGSKLETWSAQGIAWSKVDKDWKKRLGETSMLQGNEAPVGWL